MSEGQYTKYTEDQLEELCERKDEIIADLETRLAEMTKERDDLKERLRLHDMPDPERTVTPLPLGILRVYLKEDEIILEPKKRNCLTYLPQLTFHLSHRTWSAVRHWDRSSDHIPEVGPAYFPSEQMFLELLRECGHLLPAADKENADG